MKRGARAVRRRRGLELGFHLPCRGPLARVDVLTRLARAADALGYSVISISDHVVLPKTSSAPYPYDHSGAFPGGAQQPYHRADPAGRVAPGDYQAGPGRDQCPRGPLPQPGRDREAARHDGRDVGRAADRGRGGRVVARGVRGARRPAVHRARRGHRRVHQSDEGALDPERSALRRQVLPDRRRHDVSQAGPEAASADLGRGPYRASPPPHRRPGRRVAPDRAARPGGARARGAGGEAGPDPHPRSGRRARPVSDPGRLPGADRPVADPRTAAGGADGETPLGRPARQGRERSPRLRGSGRGHRHLRLPTAGSGGHGRAHAAGRPRGSAPPESSPPRSASR